MVKILEDFVIAAEIRLPALNKKIIKSFQYFGITDSIDLTNVKWEKGSMQQVRVNKFV
jgi:hypothetical protein